MLAATVIHENEKIMPNMYLYIWSRQYTISHCVCVCRCTQTHTQAHMCIYTYMPQLAFDYRLAFLRVKAMNRSLKTFKTYFNFRHFTNFLIFFLTYNIFLKRGRNKLLLDFKRCWIWVHYLSNRRTWPLASISSFDFYDVRLFFWGTIFMYLYIL